MNSPNPAYSFQFSERQSGISYGGLAQSVECDVRNVEAAGSKPAFSILMFWAGGLGSRPQAHLTFEILDN